MLFFYHQHSICAVFWLSRLKKTVCMLLQIRILTSVLVFKKGKLEQQQREMKTCMWWIVHFFSLRIRHVQTDEVCVWEEFKSWCKSAEYMKDNECERTDSREESLSLTSSLVFPSRRSKLRQHSKQREDRRIKTSRADGRCCGSGRVYLRC